MWEARAGKVKAQWTLESAEMMLAHLTPRTGRPWPNSELESYYKVDEDECDCSARDLLFFGHKCGRKAPIDKWVQGNSRS